MQSRRVLLFSDRNAVEWRKWHTYFYEFEDLIMDLDDVTLVAPPAAPGAAVRRVDRLRRRALGRAGLGQEPEIRRTRVDADHELFFAFLATATDVRHLCRLVGLRERCRTAVCFFEELYTEQVERSAAYLEILRELRFDRVFVFNPRPAAAIEQHVGCPVEFLPIGVDAVRFSPYPAPPPRVVDFFQFGRRSAVTHDAALALVERDRRFYLYDTIFNVPLEDYRAHRTSIAETMKRAEFFFSYRPADSLDRARDDDPLASRMFEGTAGGAVLLGSAPATPEYAECFPWPDATITVPFDAHELGEIIADLERQPERLARARANNLSGVARMHDWSHRWRRILEVAGLEPTARTTARLGRLEELANMAATGQ